MADLEVVQAAKRALAKSLRDDERVNGVGIAGRQPHYVIRVNIVDAAHRPDLPHEVQGIPVEVVVIGQVASQAH